MLIPEDDISEFINSKIDAYIRFRSKNDDKENTKPNVSTNWSELIRQASISEPPRFDKTGYLNNELLNAAMDKAIYEIFEKTNYSLSYIRYNLWNFLKEDIHARNDAVSTIRFLRDFDINKFTMCPECGEDNEGGWELCVYCGYDKNAIHPTNFGRGMNG